MRISEHVFEGEDIVLDFHHFDHCCFKNCRLIIHGIGSFTLRNCDVVSCEWHFNGPAATTMKILAELYQGGFAPIVEKTLEEITRGSKHN